MPAFPAELTELLSASSSVAREQAWEQLIARHSRLVLHVARSLGGGHDAAMDRYAYVLERLQDDDCRRLRAFRPDGPARFSTWLAVVVRRLCYDHHREVFGRRRGEFTLEDLQRRALGDLSRLEGDAALASIAAAVTSETEMESADRAAALAAALADLDAADRLILRLRFDDDLSAREIARIVGAPTPFHVYRRINRLLHLLRHRIAPDGDGSAPGG